MLKTSNRVFGLDVFRAVAILLVVFSHGGAISKDLFDGIPSFPLISGVELFFVLSGFLIGGILIRKIEGSEQFSWRDLLDFWKRRWFRTLPNYYLILLVNMALVYLGWAGGDFNHYNWKFWFFLHNFNSGFVGFFWESWSLSIEEWFYIFIPLTAFLSLRLLPKRRALLLTVVLGIVCPLLYRWYLSPVVYDNFWVGTNISKVVLTRIDSIAFGVLAAYIKFYHPKWWGRQANLLLLVGIVLVYACIHFRGGPNDIFFRTVFFSLYSMGCMMMLVKADQVKSPNNALLGKVITNISLISYSMYLIHFSVVVALIENFFNLETSVEKLVWYVVYWGATIGLSNLLYYAFEKPMMQLRERF